MRISRFLPGEQWMKAPVSLICNNRRDAPHSPGTTVINRLLAILHHMGQKYTNIIAAQPLYSREKELVWANPKFESVIILMGGVHICFNFLKNIGQHMYSAGLDDLWTEAGVYVTNTTQIILNGRGHQLIYEALGHLKWPLFKSWLAEHCHEHDVAVGEFSKSVGQVLKKSYKGDMEQNSTLKSTSCKMHFVVKSSPWRYLTKHTVTIQTSYCGQRI